MAVTDSFLRANAGARVKVRFKPHWPVPIGNYTLDGHDGNGIWVTHDYNGQRHILYHDIEEVELSGETEG